MPASLCSWDISFFVASDLVQRKTVKAGIRKCSKEQMRKAWCSRQCCPSPQGRHTKRQPFVSTGLLPESWDEVRRNKQWCRCSSTGGMLNKPTGVPGLDPLCYISSTWWPSPITPMRARWRQEDKKFKVNLSYWWVQGKSRIDEIVTYILNIKWQ